MEAKKRIQVYREAILIGIPRLLTELDRDPTSVTYGSFDREYWAWATKDFSNIDLQRGVYPLAMVYLNDFEGNLYHRQENLLQWIFAAIDCTPSSESGQYELKS